MPEIVITEFMDEAAIQAAFAGRDVLYDPKLVDDAARLAASLREARALIVRNRTQVRGALLASAARLEVVGRLGVGLEQAGGHLIGRDAARLGVKVRLRLGGRDRQQRNEQAGNGRTHGHLPGAVRPVRRILYAAIEAAIRHPA